MILDRFLNLSDIAVGITEVFEVIPFAAPIFGLPCNHQRTLVVPNRSLDLSGTVVGYSEISKAIPLAAPVPDLP